MGGKDKKEITFDYSPIFMVLCGPNLTALGSRCAFVPSLFRVVVFFFPVCICTIMNLHIITITKYILLAYC